MKRHRIRTVTVADLEVGDRVEWERRRGLDVIVHTGTVVWLRPAQFHPTGRLIEIDEDGTDEPAYMGLPGHARFNLIETDDAE